MCEEIKVCAIGPVKEFDISHENRCYIPYEQRGATYHGDLTFQKTRTKVSKNMDTLWRHFHFKQNYPEYYLGIANKVAICKCPITGTEEWHNAPRCLSVQNPKKGETVTVTMVKKGKTYVKDLVFVGWVKQFVHEWRMNSHSILQLEQNFVDGLFQHEKRQLKINR